MVRLFTDYSGDQWPYEKLNINFIVDKTDKEPIEELRFPPHSCRMQPPLFIPHGECYCHISSNNKYFDIDIAVRSKTEKNQVVIALDNNYCRHLYCTPPVYRYDAIYAGKYRDKVLILLNFPINKSNNIFSIQRLHKSNFIDSVIVTSTDIFVIQEQDLDEAVEEYNLQLKETFYMNIVEYNIS